jgi:hypothetical protein
MSRKYLIVAFSGMMVFSGCQSLTSKSDSSAPAAKKSSWFKFGKKEYQTPQSMAVIWKEDTIFVPGKAPTRGFGGRVYFYNEKSQAIPVEGELTVYGYDESQPHHAKINPDQADKKFKFTSEQFTKHFSESQLGASYSIWIPWDGVGGPTKKVALLPTFVTTDGKLVRGESSTQVLPGQGPAEPTLGNPAVQAVGYNEITGVTTKTSTDPGTSMRTTTIGLPSQMAQRLTQPVSTATLAARQPGEVQQPGADAKAAQIYQMLQQMNQPNTTPSAVQPAYGTAVKPDPNAPNTSVMPASTYLSAPAWPNAPLGR